MTHSDKDQSENADHTARSMASEALQLFRSHEKMNDLQFKSIEVQIESFKLIATAVNSRIDNLNKSMEAGFKSYDNKFWGLAIMAITILVSSTGALMVMVLKAGH